MATMAAKQTDLTPRSSTMPSDAAKWSAVESRDARFDGQFVYAVRSTGVYCRPSCSSRRPLKANVQFFDNPDAAERAGYRACKRCEPRADRADVAIAKTVAAARDFLDRNQDRTVSLAELSKKVSSSPSHLQRSFKRILGVSPKQYQTALRVGLFKTRLRAGDTVSRATYEAGFGSSSRVYESASKKLGMTPAAFRKGGAGVHIRFTIANAPLGRVLIATTERGVCAVELGATDSEVEKALRTDFPSATIERDDDAHETWTRAVLSRIRQPGKQTSNQIPLDVNGTAFQELVWSELQRIPIGEQRSYSQVAESIGRPTATRAVARACATNRIAVVIPCHRVVRGDGELSGYKWGIERKRTLLDEEAG
jgi:AraC family transcriptional regulator of adaptative response/methylated-DNA-[protein]-cysteine methyltransferase